MPSEIKLWQIEEDTPKPVSQDTLDLESRLEGWMRRDIGLVNDNLLVIGEQVRTAYGGIIDLLAVDADANLVILELKRDRTPREVVAQALDYASWVQNLTPEAVEKLASDFFGADKSFEQVFTDKFGDALPEIINGRHRIYIVASSLDSSTERIIEYLSEIHGVDINAATFNYFKVQDRELVGRSMLLDEEAVETRAETSGGWRFPTEEELRGIANENGVIGLWDRACREFRSISQGRTRTRGLGRERGRLMFQVRLDEGLRWFLRIYPGNSREDSLSIEIQRGVIRSYFSLNDDHISEVFGSESDTYSFDAGRLDHLIKLLKQNAPPNLNSQEM